MCGIIGCSLHDNSKYNILSQLAKLEYRGYDSCGVTDLINNQFFTFKSTNRISDLKNKKTTLSNLSIAHTRWATHGNVSTKNAHPILSNNGNYSIVHNGIIENYDKLKEVYLSAFRFITETDTEVIVNLFEYFCKTNDEIDSLYILSKLLKGSYAFIILDKKSDNMYFMKNKSPLIIGKGQDIIIASDILAFDKNVSSYYRLNDFEYGYIKNNKVFLYHNNKQIKPSFISFIYSNYNNQLNGYNHYMEKEIYETKDLLKKQIDFKFDSDIINLINSSKRIILIASGTSYHAGLLGSYFFNHLSNIESSAYIACEFEYFDYYNSDDLFIVISQSGETADLIKIVNILKNHNHNILSITNSIINTISTLSSKNINIDAGIEIAVASTKTYTLSSFILYKLACIKNNLYDKRSVINCIAELDNIYNSTDIYKDLAKSIYKNKNLFFLGSGYDNLICKEASLKLKEISYIHSESMSCGELKHGSISLITKDFPVIYFISDNGYKNTLNSIEELKSRHAKVYIISTNNVEIESDIKVSSTNDLLSFIPFSIVLQFISYYTALLLNNDIDKPRNLAKSVTVL